MEKYHNQKLSLYDKSPSTLRHAAAVYEEIIHSSSVSIYQFQWDCQQAKVEEDCLNKFWKKFPQELHKENSQNFKRKIQ